MTDQPLPRIASDRLSAEINPFGAELSVLRDADGRDLLWQGDPAWWTGRAPILFPIVGGLAQDRYRLDGATYELPKHGFARRRRFDLVAHTASSATFRLAADAKTRAVYPFDFQLDVAFEVAGAVLTMTATAANLGDRPMPASFGFHPAFLWPLPYGEAREAHRILFDRAEPEPVRRLAADGTLAAQTQPSPVKERILALDDALFVDDALIFDHPSSRRLSYGAPGAPGLDIAFDGLPHLGIWTKPGAPYLCIEPWQGHSDPSGFAGDLADKPGVVMIAPGAERRFVMSVTVTAAAAS